MSIALIHEPQQNSDASRDTVSEPAGGTTIHPADLQAVLQAWHAATDRLQETHETLQREVRRLSDELEIKNRELAARIDWQTWARWQPTWPMRCATASSP